MRPKLFWLGRHPDREAGEREASAQPGPLPATPPANRAGAAPSYREQGAAQVRLFKNGHKHNRRVAN